MHTLNILDKGHAVLFEERGEVAERKSMRCNGFGAVVLAAMLKNVLFNRGTQSAFRTRRGTLASLSSGPGRSS